MWKEKNGQLGSSLNQVLNRNRLTSQIESTKVPVESVEAKTRKQTNKEAHFPTAIENISDANTLYSWSETFKFGALVSDSDTSDNLLFLSQKKARWENPNGDRTPCVTLMTEAISIFESMSLWAILLLVWCEFAHFLISSQKGKGVPKFKSFYFIICGWYRQRYTITTWQ